MHSYFKGDWSGYGESATTLAWFHVRILQTPEGLRGYALSKALDGEGEIIEVEGTEETESKATFDLVGYLSDGLGSIPPRNAQFVVVAKPDIKQIEGYFATDAGTHGNIRFREASRWGKIQLSIPLSVHKIYRLIKKFVRCRFRIAYFAFVVVLAVLSVSGKLPSKIGTMEVVVLLVPLIFLFSDKLRELIQATAVRKIGPVEFQEQAKPSPQLNIRHLGQVLHDEFGDKVPLFSVLTELLVSRTKNLLRLIVSLDRSLTRSEFNALAKKIGVPDQNLGATLEVLKRSGCITISDKGELLVQEVGKQFLHFESRLAQIYGH